MVEVALQSNKQVWIRQSCCIFEGLSTGSRSTFKRFWKNRPVNYCEEIPGNLHINVGQICLNQATVKLTHHVDLLDAKQ